MNIKNHRLGDEQWEFDTQYEDSVSFSDSVLDEKGDPILDENKDPIYHEITLTKKDALALAEHFGLDIKESQQ